MFVLVFVNFVWFVWVLPQSFLTFSSPLPPPVFPISPFVFPSRSPLPFQVSQCPPWLNGRLPLEACFRCRVLSGAYGFVQGWVIRQGSARIMYNTYLYYLIRIICCIIPCIIE